MSNATMMISCPASNLAMFSNRLQHAKPHYYMASTFMYFLVDILLRGMEHYSVDTIVGRATWRGSWSGNGIAMERGNKNRDYR